MPRTSPTGRRRHLARELLHLREVTGLTADEVAKRLGWTPSTLTRIERNDWRLPKIHLVEALLDVYGVTGSQRDELIGYALQARERGWWERYKHLSAEEGTYIGLEHEASAIRQFAPMRLPDLLQIPGYCRSRHAGAPDIAADHCAVTSERQRLLTAPAPVTLWALLWESVLHHQVAGPDVQAEQLEHLLAVTDLPNVTIQVVPFTAGPLPAIGGFTHMALHDAVDPEAVYVESPAGETWIEDPARVAHFTAVFERLLSVACTVRETQDVVARTARALRKG
ncbi:helix-turn-helix domain-containing protein [Actinomadura viridis]|uniref:helix-turn-helix domain-containing protein n=1 Tax=Actinomadura viridis TaxID=58110 RepID=UPI0036A0B395